MNVLGNRGQEKEKDGCEGRVFGEEEEGLFGQGVDEVDAEALPSFHPPIQMQKWTWRWFHLHSADERGEVELRDVSLSFPAFLFDSEYTFFF